MTGAGYRPPGWWHLARAAAGLPRFLAHAVDSDAARRALRERLESRRQRFLSLVRAAIYANTAHPAQRLLAWAGCEPGDLEKLVASDGLEGALERLRDDGVFLTFDEAKGHCPVRRGSQVMDLREEDVDNPGLAGGGLAGRSSGTRSAGSAVVYDWRFIVEEAENERLLHEAHGLVGVPAALWYPRRAGLAGIHNLLISLKWGQAPEKWFSQTAGQTLRDRALVGLLRACGVALGLRMPEIEHVPATRAAVVAAWMAERRRTHGRATLRTYASSGVRAVEAALENGWDVSGCTVFVGGEPLSETARDRLSASGAALWPRYVASETGLVAAACGHDRRDGAMHVYTDRLALVSRAHDGEAGDLLFTTLSPFTPKVLLNTDLGDCGVLRRHDCPCLLGQSGLDLHVRQVASGERLTAEGMSVLVRELDLLVAELLAPLGAGREDFQFLETTDPDGRTRVVIAVNPRLDGLDAEALCGRVYDGLSALRPRLGLASELWRQAGVLQARRQPPLTTAGAKTPRLVRGTRAGDP